MSNNTKETTRGRTSKSIHGDGLSPRPRDETDTTLFDPINHGIGHTLSGLKFEGWKGTTLRAHHVGLSGADETRSHNDDVNAKGGGEAAQVGSKSIDEGLGGRVRDHVGGRVKSGDGAYNALREKKKVRMCLSVVGTKRAIFPNERCFMRSNEARTAATVPLMLTLIISSVTSRPKGIFGSKWFEMPLTA